MGPKKEWRDFTDTDDVYPVGKGKGRAKSPRTLSNGSITDVTPEALDAGLEALRRISRILCFMQTFGEEIGSVEGAFDLHRRQQDRIKELDTTLDELSLRRDRELVRLQDENDDYKDKARQFEHEREILRGEQATMDETRKEIQSELERKKVQEINELRQEFLDRHKTSVKQVREELGKTIQGLETDRSGLKNTIKTLEEEKTQAQQDLKQQKESSELDKRSSQSHIKRLESELHQINAASAVSPQTPEFYVDGFRQLWESIREVAEKDFQYLPEDTKPLESEAVRDGLSGASKIFRYPPLSTESPVATFLRACAIQNFLSTKVISIIRRQYFAEPTAAAERKAGTQPMDFILDTISNVPAANSSQELSWRLTTADKLDRLGSHSPSLSTTVSTGPDQADFVREILDHLHYFQNPSDQRLHTKLSEIAGMTITLWSALRKDNCQIDFHYSPRAGGGQEWDFVDDVATSSFEASNMLSESTLAQLPSEPFVLFPRITGSFDSDDAPPQVLHTGAALSHDCPAFREGLQEINHIDNETKALKRRLRRGSSVQSSPIVSKRQGDWPAPHRGYN